MNWNKHYNLLIEKAKNRDLQGYTELHHIIPRSMGGSNDKNNLIRLTAREHFIAHLLLTKIYPDKPFLIRAVQMMCVQDKNQDRSMNRMYGWIREKFSKEISINQTGEGNSQYGTCWIYNQELKKSKKIKKDELNVWLNKGWLKGRKIVFKEKEVKISKRELFQLELKNRAEKYFALFKTGDFTSVRSFAKTTPFSHVTLTKLFKKFIPEYNTEKGKSFTVEESI